MSNGSISTKRGLFFDCIHQGLSPICTRETPRQELFSLPLCDWDLPCLAEGLGLPGGSVVKNQRN